MKHTNREILHKGGKRGNKAFARDKLLKAFK